MASFTLQYSYTNSISYPRERWKVSLCVCAAASKHSGEIPTFSSLVNWALICNHVALVVHSCLLIGSSLLMRDQDLLFKNFIFCTKNSFRVKWNTNCNSCHHNSFSSLGRIKSENRLFFQLRHADQHMTLCFICVIVRPCTYHLKLV